MFLPVLCDKRWGMNLGGKIEHLIKHQHKGRKKEMGLWFLKKKKTVCKKGKKKS